MNQNGNPGRRNNYKYFHKNSIWKGLKQNYEGWNFNSGNYLFTTDTK